MLLIASGNELCWKQGINCVGFQVSMVLVTGLCQERVYQWNQGRGINGCIIAGVALARFVVFVIREPHCDFPLADFFKLQRAEAR